MFFLKIIEFEVFFSKVSEPKCFSLKCDDIYESESSKKKMEALFTIA